MEIPKTWDEIRNWSRIEVEPLVARLKRLEERVSKLEAQTKEAK